MPTATIQVNSIRSDQNSPTVSLVQGATIPSGKTISCNGNMNVVGILSATSFSGDASRLTNVPFTNSGKAISISLIVG